ncbi:glycoside hydrolase family 73 protein [Clostridium beijerinckii]|uniref:glycoside hydrolase family 73 protein n=1 Tax=Clostridium beijerinckii TaxID=1520 RepID=UPI00098BFD4D|nr:glucosaminidase domain-containing protein [Clostridium beijerinckii]NRT77075.1 flagellum-specific peptidoglycan hydrolase FlgJ [Clostridium beijerinckii]OOM47332.1 Exo-glucosaminidase LytG precursor [Clostridium beijerinckii]
MNTRKRKRGFKRVILNIIAFGIIAFAIFGVYSGYMAKYNNINLKDLNTKMYIQDADNASKGKLQVNWKFMAAIDGVRYKNDFSKATDSSINQLANMFIDKNSSTSIKIKNSQYKLVDLDTVLDKLSFDKEQKEKVYKYLDDLKYIGSQKNNLKDESKQGFINDLYPEAIEIYDKYGILPSITISQAILESGWGKSDLSTKANNLFGIKADSGWTGKKIKMSTSEYYKQKIEDYFRVYSSKEDSMKDYGEFLSNNKRYKQSGVFQAADYLDQANAIEKAGYSTVENDKGEEIYSKLLIGVIQEQNLQLLDFECEMNYFKDKK